MKKNLLKTTALIFALQGAAAIAPGLYANAQDGDADEPEARTLGTITVTSRKQEESLLEIPVAVTAFDAAKIEDLALTDITDVQNFTPGFTYETFGTTVGRLDNVPRFRGVTSNTANPTRQTASVFVDGIYVFNGVQGIDFNDIERIEAIKGPQSAFFGRNTFGGAINFITRKPTDEFSGRISATAATKDLYELSGSVEGPLVGDWLSGRVSASYRDKGGHHTSSFDGGTVGDEKTWSVAGSLYIEPTANFEGILRASYFENDDGPAAATSVGQDFLNCGPTSFEGNPLFPNLVAGQQGPLGGAEAFFCGTLPVPQANVPTTLPAGIRTALENAPNPLGLDDGRRAEAGFGLDRQSLRLSAQFEYTFDNGVVLSSLTGYNEDEVTQLRVGEGNNFGPPAFYAPDQRTFEDINQEVRLSGSALGEALDWSIGFNYSDQEYLNGGAFGLFSGFLFGGTAVTDRSNTTTGIFGSLGYDVTDKVRVSLEGRYQEDEVFEDSNISDGTPGNEATFDSFLPRAIIEYTPDSNTLLYVSYAEGNLPGGFNPDVISLGSVDRAALEAIQPFTSETFDEETLKSYEIGWKRGFADGSGSITLAGYYMDRSGQTFRSTTQLTLADGTDDFLNQFLNIGNSEIYGIEVETVWSPVEHLTLDATLSYTDSEFAVFESANQLRVRGFADTAGNQSERFAKVSGSFSWQYEDAINSEWDWFFRNDNIYNGDRFASEVNLAKADETLLSNLRLGARNDKYRVELFGTNVLNDKSPVAAVRSTDLGSVVTRTAGARPFQFLIGLRDRAQYGVRVSANF